MARRRGHGEGSVYQRQSDGRWVGSIEIGDPTGVRRRRVVYGRTQAEVVQQLTRLRYQALEGRSRSVLQPLTVGTYLAQWLEDVSPRLRPSTRLRYRQIVDHCAPLARIQLDRLTPADVQRLLRQLLDSGLSPRTVAQIRQILSSALQRAIRWELVRRNVVALTDPPRVERHLPTVLDVEDARRLIAAAEQHPLGGPVILALTTGMRLGELLGLRWDAVDLAARTLEVRQSRGPWGVGPPKSSRGLRTIHLPELAYRALARERERTILAIDGWVWHLDDGRPLPSGRLSRAFHRLLRETGLPHMRFHDLRHSTASLLLAQGVPARVVMEVLGHAHVSITLDVYSTVLPSIERMAAEAIDRALS